MQDAKFVSTPLSTSCDLTPTSDAPSYDIREFRPIISSIQYLYLTHPDVSLLMNKLSQYMHAPTEIHMKVVKRLLHYLKGTLNHGLHLSRTNDLSLKAFCDSDLARDILMIASLLLPILFIWGPMPSLGPLKSNPLLLNLHRRLNIEL